MKFEDRVGSSFGTMTSCKYAYSLIIAALQRKCYWCRDAALVMDSGGAGAAVDDAASGNADHDGDALASYRR